MQIPRIVEFNEGKWWTTASFEIYKGDVAKLVKQVLDILCTDVWWKIAHIDTSVAA